MLAVRYVALAALVVWLGGTIVVSLLVAPAAFDVLPALSAGRSDVADAFVAEIGRRFHLLAYACGGVLFVSLFVMKFVGPPPVGFVPRAAIVAVMIALAVYSGSTVSRWVEMHQPPAGDGMRAEALHERSIYLMSLNIALGSVLLYWYARE